MKAPTDKKNDTIQIIVTTACDLFNCSNCTQLLPFRRDVRHMGLACFEQAVRSVAKWPGVIGLFGGNPCCHPLFPDLCEILKREIPEQRRRGIWTNNLMGHGAIVRDTFYPHGRFNLNAHVDKKAAKEINEWLPGKLIPGSDVKQSWHCSILVDYRDLGILWYEWVRMREACDINQNWSAGIVERDGKPYAYFCEVAAALDGVRGENHGIPAMSGWWKAKMPAFDPQVSACCDRGCGVPLRGIGSMDREDTYDVSASWQSVIGERTGKPALRFRGDMPEACSVATDYMRCQK